MRENQCIGREHYPKAAYGRLVSTGLKVADRQLLRVREASPVRAHIFAQYLNEMRDAVSEMWRVSKPGGHVVLVCGDNRVAGRPFRTSAFLAALFQEAGFLTRFCLVDSIQSRGLMTKRNPTAGLISKERVISVYKSRERIMADTSDALVRKLQMLTQHLWSDMVNWPMIRDWLNNFPESQPGRPSEQLHGAFLLSQFMFFGIREMRELLKALYRDVYKYPIVERLRRSQANSMDCGHLTALFKAELHQTRFLGVGNPSESGTHLLYYFRQENSLPRKLFINGHEVFDRNRRSHNARPPEP